MTIERFLGGITALCGVLLLLYGIPANVAHVEDAMMAARTFPQMAAWIFIVAGIVQMIFVKSKLTLPTLRELLRVILVLSLILAMVFLMEHFGYLVGAMSLMAAVMVIIYERRPLWLLIAIAAVPIGVWVLFEVLLLRPLP